MKTQTVAEKLLGASCWSAGVMLILSGVSAQASFSLGDAANYTVLYEGNGAHSLQINNGPGPGGLAVSGNIGIGDGINGTGTPQLQLSGPVTINGNINFAGAVNDNAPYNGNLVVNGSISGGMTSVETDLQTLNSLSSTLGSEAGHSLAINTSSGSQIVNVSAGAIDGSGNSIFSVSSVSFNNGQTLTIHGDGTHSVVFNIDASTHFSGNIVLTGGLTSDQVLFNIIGGNGATLSGGNTLQTAANGGILTGTFLDPNGAINVNNVVINGRLFGGDSSDMQIVSGAEINAPLGTPVPEAATVFAGALLLLPLGLQTLRQMRKTIS
jgi:hypothetical protein